MNNMICIIDWNKGQNDGYSKDFSIITYKITHKITQSTLKW